MLRRWQWRRLRRRVARPQPAPAVRPGDAVIEGCRAYVAALQKGNEELVAQALRQALSAEAAIAPSGITREGSSGRQAQLAAYYAAAWLAARRRGRPEQWRLAALARSVQAALTAITLPGGLPRIGDMPEDTPPEIADEDKPALEELQRQARLHDLEALRQDGWLRLDAGPWSGLWHCPADGWPMNHGLAHQDLGAGELHFKGVPLFIDPGMAPAERGLDPLYRSAAMHGGISLLGRDPYPFDRPLYDAAFRHDIAGPAPLLRGTGDGVQVAFDGYARLGGHRRVERHWRFEGSSLRIDDLVLGTGRPRIERRLITPWPAIQAEGGILLHKGDHRLILSAELPASLHMADQGLSVISFTIAANLPWRGAIDVRPLP